MSQLSSRTLRENVESALRMKILNQELAPGTRVVEQNLAKEFGVSRGPIREALRQLEHEGLVEYVRNAGCSVKKITAEDLYELYLMRASYEILSIELCGGVFTGEEFQAMERVLEEMRTIRDGDVNHVVSCDFALHKIIIEKSRLPRLLKAWEELNFGSIVASISSDAYQAGLARRQFNIHSALVDALRGGDTAVIRRAIYDHYMFPVKSIFQDSGLPLENYKFFA